MEMVKLLQQNPLVVNWELICIVVINGGWLLSLLLSTIVQVGKMAQCCNFKRTGLFSVEAVSFAVCYHPRCPF